MTTNAIDALAHLQDNPRSPQQSIAAWLDVHRDDAIVLCQSKGVKMASELIGITPSAIYSWRTVRGLDFKSPRLSRDGRIILEDENGKRVRTQRYEEITHGGSVETPPPDTPEYIRGQRDAYRHALALVAPAVKLLSHK